MVFLAGGLIGLGWVELFLVDDYWELLRRHGAHVDELPAVTVGVGEAVLIHEAIVLWLSVGGATGSHGFGDEIFHLSAALAAQAVQHLNGFGGVADRLWREVLELRMGEDHHMNVLADDNAGCVIIGELRVVGKAQGFEEGPGAREIRDGKVDEDLSAHGCGCDGQNGWALLRFKITTNEPFAGGQPGQTFRK
jgi:hypothetical protein